MYNAHFKFRESPFGVTPDPQFYYSNTANADAWTTLRRGIEERRGLILILGEPGTGKTTLLRKALQSFGPDMKTAYVSQTLIDRTSFLALILDDLGLAVPSGDSASMIERLRQFSIEQSRAGNTVALLIDEAHDLSPQCLEDLINLQTDNNDLFQIVLAGQSELEQKLNRAELLALKERTAHRFVLEPLKLEEVGPYIDTRLQAIGHRGAELFDTKAIEAIAAFSKGVPRVVNLLCDHALLVAYVTSASMVTADMVEEVAGDLLIGRPRSNQNIPVRSAASSGSPQAVAPVEAKPESKITPDQKMFAVGVNDRPAESRRSMLSFDKRFRHAFAALAIVGLMVSGAFLYFREGAIFDSDPRTDIAASRAAPPTEVHPPAEPPPQASDVAALREPAPPPPIEPTRAASSTGITAPLPAQPSIDIPIAEPNTAKEKPPAARAGDKEKKPEKAQRADQEPGKQRANFVVVGRSFVRARPTSNAEIIATLEPGANINIAGRSGEYFQVRSLGREPVAGFVHREDAFFERKN
jgi:general secretion pathway protein A